ncbi:probable ubiquitin-conjugating enzyme E2 25 [Hibiscus syriacus]|uniref:probable ubiquitin-conjugating enzyme E2 25 n=1 Tax=Hibiscus syriacus TaxID=106335 RepID=UPI00192131BF|nr:probable ubiquitin-conjugating enzyme E2 25 [Hibiscus syriacus]
MVPRESGSDSKGGNGDMQKFLSFKHFDVVDDSRTIITAYELIRRATKGVGKAIQEWKILEKDLAETIYVRVYEGRMDLLRAIIIGPAGTPYTMTAFCF